MRFLIVCFCVLIVGLIACGGGGEPRENFGGGSGAEDCNGVAGGKAFIDDCGECVKDEKDKNKSCKQDCNGDWGGSAKIDNCRECRGGKTGKEPCKKDCNNEWGGTAKIDICKIC